ncbi:MAG: metallophosphoesterase, partial [Bacteroidota bacterium]|nr:metallophosphoesterase [Bacteroidota bacterium]
YRLHLTSLFLMQESKQVTSPSMGNYVNTHYTLVHLSDLHLSPAYFPERTSYLRQSLEFCLAQRADHIVITGDITNQARKEELQACRSVLAEFGLLDSAKLTMIIGNHDVYGGPHHADDVLQFPRACRTADYDAKVNEFVSAFQETFDGVKTLSQGLFGSESSVFPFVKEQGNVVLLGVNSVARWSSLGNPLGSNGEINDAQFNAMRSYLESDAARGKTVILLVHHHFNKLKKTSTPTHLERLCSVIESETMKLRSKGRLFALCTRNDIARVLHGHVHETEVYKRAGVQFVNAGASFVPVGSTPRKIPVLTIAGGILSTAMHVLAAPALSLYQGSSRLRHTKVFYPKLETAPSAPQIGSRAAFLKAT